MYGKKVNAIALFLFLGIKDIIAKKRKNAGII